jgi:hypothetical protein
MWRAQPCFRSHARVSFASAGLAVALGLGAAPLPARSITRTHLVTLPKEAEKHTLYVSDDGTDCVYVVASPDGRRVVHGAATGPPFAEITAPRMAPGTTRVFYWGLDTSTGKRAIYLVADGPPLYAPIGRAGRLFFSPAGGHWAAVGGTELPTGTDSYEAGPVQLWVDGNAVNAYPDMSSPSFTTDGGHLAYLVQNDAGQVVLFEDDRMRRAFDPPDRPTLGLSEHNSVGPSLSPRYQTAYLADGNLLTLSTDRDGWAVFRGTARLASYPRTVAQTDALPGGGGDPSAAFIPGTLVTAAAAPVAVWWERLPGIAERWRVVRDGAPIDGLICPRPWDAAPPVLSADGRHIAYACHTATDDGPQDEVYVFHDGTRYGPYANVWGIALSPDGRHVAFGAVNDTNGDPWFYVVDGRRGRPLFDKVFPPRFSADSQHVAWVGKRKGRFVLFLDRHGCASSDDLIWPPTFDLGKGLSWAVIRGQRVSRVEFSP